MNAIDVLIRGYEQACAFEENERHGKRVEELQAAEAEALKTLRIVFAQYWDELKGYVSVHQVKIDRVIFHFRVEPVELDDFLAVINKRGDQWKFAGLADMTNTFMQYESSGELFSKLRGTFKRKRNSMLLNELDKAETAEQAKSVLELLIRNQPERVDHWNELYSMRVRYLQEHAAWMVEHEKRLHEYETDFRSFLIQRMDAKVRNRAEAERVKDLINIPRAVQELGYATPGDEGIEIKYIWVLGPDREDGWWRLASGERMKFFNPVSLGDIREVRPYDLVPGCYERYWHSGSDSVFYHWPDHDIRLLIENADFREGPEFKGSIQGLTLNECRLIRMKVTREIDGETASVEAPDCVPD